MQKKEQKLKKYVKDFQKHYNTRLKEDAKKNSTSNFTTLIFDHRAITLIALIITIIIMLILVGVTVSVAINGGLFTSAKKAKIDTQNEINKENELSEGIVNIDGNIYDSIDEYIGEAEVKQEGNAINVSDYGKRVINFESEFYPDIVWRVFYEDKDNVYLISETADGGYPENDVNISDEIEYYESGADVSEEGQALMPLAKEAGLFKETNTNKNILVTAFLCDTSMWDGYIDAEEKAVWAMGGPTIELFIASYNSTQVKTEVTTVSSFGYDAYIKGLLTEMNNGIYRLKINDNWWIASPGSSADSVLNVNNVNGRIVSGVITSRSVRPIVCIPQYNFNEFKLEE